VTANPGGRTASWIGSGALTATIAGLTNGTPYTFAVTAMNALATGPASTASNSATPGPLGAPTNLLAIASSTKAVVTWTAPVSNGGSSITAYIVTANPGGATATWSSGALTATVTGLTNGVPYTFTATATTALATGSASLPSSAVTPAAPLSAPTNVSATTGNAQAVVTWTAPVSNGGSSITAYTVTANPGGATASWSSGALTATVTGLTNGTAYTFTVTATNSIGASSASSNSSAVTPTALGAPTNVSAVASSTQAVVTWTVPVSNGGSSITAYTVTASPGGATATWSSGALTATVTGLTNGVPYTFTATATTALATGPASLPSSAVTPAAPLSAPTNVSATTGNAQAVVTWTAPISNGGSPVTAYIVTANPGGATASWSSGALTATVTGLTNGTAYTFTVTASNAVGNSSASTASNTVTPGPIPISFYEDFGGSIGSASNCCSIKLKQTWYTVPGMGSNLATGTIQAKLRLYGSFTEAWMLWGNTGLAFTTVAANITRLKAPDTAGNDQYKPLPQQIQPRDWHVYTLVRTSSDVTLYVDGFMTVIRPEGLWTDSPIKLGGTNPYTYAGGSTAYMEIDWIRVSDTIATIPSAPTNVAATAGDGQAVVTWSAPSSNGGSAITAYTVTANPGGATASWSSGALTATVTGLTNGTSYTFTVTATNSVGESAASSSAAVTLNPPDTGGGDIVPGVTSFAAIDYPTDHDDWIFSGTKGDRVNIGMQILSSTSNSYVQLYGPNGFEGSPKNSGWPQIQDWYLKDTGTYIIRASSDLSQTGSYSLGLQYEVISDTPGGPITNGATVLGKIDKPGDTDDWTFTGPAGQTVSIGMCTSTQHSNLWCFVQLVDPNGNVEANGGWHSSSKSSSIQDHVLQLSGEYVIKAASRGPAPEQMHEVGQYGLSFSSQTAAPGAPTNVLATASNGEAVVTWSAPADGGATITGYTVTASPGGATATWSSGALTATVTGLTNGTAYTFTVTAANSVGGSPESSPYSAVTPATLPGAPTNVLATASNGQAVVTWTAPASDGGFAITGYTVTANPGGATVMVGGGTLTATFTVLDSSTLYTFSVQANTSGGASAHSSPSTDLFFYEIANWPASGSVNTITGRPHGGDISKYTFLESIDLSPAVGYPIDTPHGIGGATRFEFTCSTSGRQLREFSLSIHDSAGVVLLPSGMSKWSAWAPCDVVKYFNDGQQGTYEWIKIEVTSTASYGTYYYPDGTIRDPNDTIFGQHTLSLPTVTVISAPTAPGAPTNVSATAGNAQAIVTWSAPSSDGGSAITGYTVTASPGGATAIWSSGDLTATVTGLSNGQDYTFTVIATNAVGNSAASSASSAIPVPIGGGGTIAYQKLIASDKAAEDRFGKAVAISGNTAVVGAWQADPDGTEGAGAAYVFVRNGTTWSEQQKLAASDKAAGDRFGYSVAISGDTMVVGAYFADPDGVERAGAAYVFVRNGTAWTEQQKLTASGKAAYDAFGTSVAVSGDTVVVGAYVADSDGIDRAGAAYVFIRSDSTWTQQQKLTASDKATSNHLGYSVAISGDTIVVGAHGAAPEGVTQAGAAYVFTRSGSTWSEQQKLTASDKAAEDSFGRSVAISGNTVVAGAHGATSGGLYSAGAAYVFTRTGSTWTQQQKLTASDKAAENHFGISVAISEDAVVAGAYAAAPDGVTNAGAAYLFVRSGSTWSEQQKLTASDKAQTDLLGASVAIDADTIAVGAAYVDTDGVINAGAAYVFIVQ
jgi:hypothetical protein